MAEESDEAYLAHREQQELDLAAAATDPAVEAIHLDLAARYRKQRGLVVRGETAPPRAAGHD